MLGSALAQPAFALNASAPQARFARVVQRLADIIRVEYQDPMVAARIADALPAHLAAGRYNAHTPDAFAERVTADLRTLSHDQHFAVHYQKGSSTPASQQPYRREPEPPPPKTPEHPSPRGAEILAPDNYGVAAASCLSGNIGYLDIQSFPPLFNEVKVRYGAAMTLLADTWGLIIDLTKNGGGDGDSVAYLLSYLFDREPFVLCRYESRNSAPTETKTSHDLVGPRYGETRPVVIAIAKDTFSAAEEAAYDLQALKRGTIVGERSRGGANPGDFFDLGDDFNAFVSQGRAVNPITNANWEGVGVQPDIRASASATLLTAHRTTLEAVLRGTTIPARRQIVEDALKALPPGAGPKPGK